MKQLYFYFLVIITLIILKYIFNFMGIDFGADNYRFIALLCGLSLIYSEIGKGQR